MVMKGIQTIDDVITPKGIVVAYPISAGAVDTEGIDFGYCTEASLSIIDATKNRFSPRDGNKSKIYERVIKTDYSIPITCISENPDNFALIFRQEKTTESQDEGHYTFGAPYSLMAPVILDRVKKLTKRCVSVFKLEYDGGTGTFESGRVVTGTGGAMATIVFVEGTIANGVLWCVNKSGTFVDNEEITDPVAGAAKANGIGETKGDIVLLDVTKIVKYVVDTDYGVHEDSGSIFFISGGSIVAAANLYAIFDYAALAETIIKKGSSGIDNYEIHILPQNVDGRKIEWIFFNCAIHTNTTLKLISEADADAEISIILTPQADGPNATSEYPYFKERFIT